MPGQAAHQVQRQREHLERDEHGEQIVGGREQHHAADGEHGQREHLGLGDPGLNGRLLGEAARNRGGLRGERVQARCDPPRRTRTVRIGFAATFGDQQHADDREPHDGALQQQGGPVDGDCSHGRELSGAGADGAVVAHHGDERRDQPDQGEHDLDAVPAPVRCEGLHQHTGHRDDEHDQHRRQHGVFNTRRGHRDPSAVSSGAGSDWWIDDSVSSTAGLMTSRAILG